MMNIESLSKIDVKKNQILPQDSQGAKAKPGRPLRPNMVKKLVKVDKYLYAQIGELAKKNHTTIAALIANGMKVMLEKETN